MKDGKSILHVRLAEWIRIWEKNDSVPSHTEFETIGRELLAWKIQKNIPGLWIKPPLMVTATLDDGLGQGLRLIHLYADITGLQVIPLGLLQPSDRIIAACKEHVPDILGLTILQFDSEDDITKISQAIPEKIQIVAGGPVFNIDSEFAKRTGVDFAAKNVAAFLAYLIGQWRFEI